MQAFNLLSVLIERLADGVAPFADGLLALLSQVWRSGEGQSLLRAQARALLLLLLLPAVPCRTVPVVPVVPHSARPTAAGCV